MSGPNRDDLGREHTEPRDDLDQWGQVYRPLPPPPPPAPPIPAPRRSLLAARVTWRSVVVVVACVIAFRLWVVESAIVDGDSMLTTLSNNEWVLVLKPLHPHRFSVVVLTDPQAKEIVVKRVVGMPGDEVSSVMVGPPPEPGEPIRTRLTVNGVVYDEPYARSTGGVIGPAKVPPDSYFVLGDNRDISVDSRRYGFVPAANLRGVALMVVSPLSKMRIITTTAQPVADQAAPAAP